MKQDELQGKQTPDTLCGGRNFGKTDRARPRAAVLAALIARASAQNAYCGGLTPSLVICTRVALILPPASVVTVTTAY